MIYMISDQTPLLFRRELFSKLPDDRQFEILTLKSLDQTHDPRNQDPDDERNPNEGRNQSYQRAHNARNLSANQQQDKHNNPEHDANNGHQNIEQQRLHRVKPDQATIFFDEEEY